MQRRPTSSAQADYLITLGCDLDSIPLDRAAATQLIDRLAGIRDEPRSVRP